MWKKHTLPIYANMANAMPFITILFVVFFGSLVTIDMKFSTAFGVVCFINSFIMLICYGKTNAFKLMVGCFSVLVVFIMCTALWFSVFFDMSSSRVKQTSVSLDKKYVATLVEFDEGALGGSNDIRVRKNKPNIPLGFGILQTKEKTVYVGRWNEINYFAWREDNQTILLNDRTECSVFN